MSTFPITETRSCSPSASLAHREATWSVKIIGLTLVLITGMFLIVAGFGQSQTAPMMGLLGTVAGYLLGKEARPQL